LIFKSEDGKFADARYGIMEIFKKPGLVDEALGELVDLTPERLYHKCLLGNHIKSFKIFAISILP